MNTTLRVPSALAIAIAAALLAACGGGGSNVRPNSISPTDTTTTPPPAGLCPSPLTSDCVVTDTHDAAGNLIGNQYMEGGRTSAYALVVRLTTTLGLEHGVFRFDGGTRVESGTLVVEDSATLDSDAQVLAGGTLLLIGNLQGSLANDGRVMLTGKVTGNVANNGNLGPDTNVSVTTPGLIDGNLAQSSTGTLVAVMGTDGGYLSVTGRADIDGTLELSQATDNDMGAPVPPPAAPFSVQVLHADGGVYGQFAQWTSPGLFITGSLRYAGNDVFFDATAISAAQAMATANVDSVTLAGAGQFDAALANAGTIRNPGDGMSLAQRELLGSAALIQRIQDYGQATRTFDSLSGVGQLAATDALLREAALPSSALVGHVAGLRPGQSAGAWAARPALSVAGAGAFNRQFSGFDQWLGDGLVAGGSIGWSEGSLRFERSDTAARDLSPQWDFYVRRSGAGNTYVFGDVGASRHQVELGRTIDLGLVTRTARSRREFSVQHAYVEAGRDFAFAGGRLTPFVAASWAALRGDAFVEQGTTGFELLGQPSLHRRVDAAAGLRLARQWRVDDRHWLQLNLSGGYLQRLHADDRATAAFTGAPDVRFNLAELPGRRSSHWMQMSLGAGSGNWTWLLGYDREDGTRATSFNVQRRF